MEEKYILLEYSTARTNPYYRIKDLSSNCIIEIRSEDDILSIKDTEVAENICALMLSKTAHAKRIIPEEYKTNSMYLIAVQLGQPLSRIPKKNRTLEICTIAIDKNADNFTDVPKEIVNLQMCIDVVRRNIRKLCYVPDEFFYETYKSEVLDKGIILPYSYHEVKAVTRGSDKWPYRKIYETIQRLGIHIPNDDLISIIVQQTKLLEDLDVETAKLMLTLQEIESQSITFCLSDPQVKQIYDALSTIDCRKRRALSLIRNNIESNL